MATTGDITMVQIPRLQRAQVKLLDKAKTTIDNTGWVGVGGFSDASITILGFDNANPNSADVEIRVHNSKTRPPADDNGVTIYTATMDAAFAVVAPVEWIKANMTRVTNAAGWASTVSVDVHMTGNY